MVVESAIIELQIDSATNLKERRSVLRSAIQLLRNTKKLSVAEVGDDALVNYGEIGIASVGKSALEVAQTIDAALETIDRTPEICVVGVTREVTILK
ncbi:MAG: DUF503 domain-containing protein [Armatimonadetes bacterium]|nr:DUF503 domain-containing protein [Armatimonadota bacterium]